MKKKIDIIGILVGLCIVALGVLSSQLWGTPKSVGVGLSAAGGAICGLSVMVRYYKKMEKDKNFSREINDERNIVIKHKSGYIINLITLILIGVATVLFIALEYYVPACVTGAILMINMILLFLVPARVGKTL